MKFYEKVLAKIYKFLSEIGAVAGYNKLVQWCRKHWLGRALHRILRAALIAGLLVFLTNIDPSNLSSVEGAFSAALIAGLDKAFNEGKAYLRKLTEKLEKE